MNLILAQAEAHKLKAKQREETQRAEAKQREEAQRLEAQNLRAEALKREEAQRMEAQILRTEAIRREEMSLAREQMMAKMKADTEEASLKREQALRKEKVEADELKRQKVMVEANTTLQQERVKADVHREVAHMKALERREAEFRQQQEREREQARDAQLKLRELAARELKERVHLERELVKQQQQNVILQKQREVDRLEAQVDRHLLQQAQDNLAKPISKATLAPMREEVVTPSPEVVELTEPDTPPSSQNRPKLTRRVPSIAVDVGVQACSAPVSESSVSTLTYIRAPSGIPLPTSVGPLVLPMGPEIVAAPQPKVSLNLGQSVYTAGTRPVGPQVSTIGHLSTPQLPISMAIQPAQAYQSLVPPLVPTSVLGSTLSTSVVPTYVHIAD